MRRHATSGATSWKKESVAHPAALHWVSSQACALHQGHMEGLATDTGRDINTRLGDHLITPYPKISYHAWWA